MQEGVRRKLSFAFGAGESAERAVDYAHIVCGRDARRQAPKCVRQEMANRAIVIHSAFGFDLRFL